MLEIASKKFSNENIKFINSTFEEGCFDEQYDLIYAASAFQWINDNNRVHKVYGLLNDGGTFVRFKTMNVIISEKSEVNSILLDIYQKNIPDYLPNDKESKHMKDCEYLDAGFKDMTREVYYIDRNYSINNYLKLINTYTEYVVLPENLRREFEHEIKEKIGDSDFVLTQKCTLFMARR
jgi:ubiquinone/menaquinone biosynthesis C-methylase UbiE